MSEISEKQARAIIETERGCCTVLQKVIAAESPGHEFDLMMSAYKIGQAEARSRAIDVLSKM